MLTILDFDNSPSKITSRLLEMYPVEVLKAEYEVTGVWGDVVEQILKKTTINDLKEDALRLMGHCRQHVFVFRHDLKAGQLPNKILTQNTECENLSVDTHDRKEIEYLLLNKYHFVQVKGNTAIHHRSFNWWPVKIVVRPGYLELRITIAERHNKSEPPFFYSERDFDEKSIVGVMFAAIGHKIGLLPVDLNRGLKKVWESNIIDSKFITRKGAKSVDTSLMDVGYTFKKDFPERYNDLIADPLRKSVFESTNEKDGLPPSFHIDAEQGFLAFRGFPRRDDAINKIMDLLIKNN
jgi:hypothetical protein